MTLPICLFSMLSCRLFIIVRQAHRFLVSLNAFATTSSGCSPLRSGRKTLLAHEEGGSTTYPLRAHVPGACKNGSGTACCILAHASENRAGRLRAIYFTGQGLRTPLGRGRSHQNRPRRAQGPLGPRQPRRVAPIAVRARRGSPSRLTISRSSRRNAAMGISKIPGPHTHIRSWPTVKETFERKKKQTSP